MALGPSSAAVTSGNIMAKALAGGGGIGIQAPLDSIPVYWRK